MPSGREEPLWGPPSRHQTGSRPPSIYRRESQPPGLLWEPGAAVGLGCRHEIQVRLVEASGALVGSRGGPSRIGNRELGEMEIGFTETLTLPELWILVASCLNCWLGSPERSLPRIIWSGTVTGDLGIGGCRELVVQMWADSGTGSRLVASQHRSRSRCEDSWHRSRSGRQDSHEFSLSGGENQKEKEKRRGSGETKEQGSWDTGETNQVRVDNHTQKECREEEKGETGTELKARRNTTRNKKQEIIEIKPIKEKKSQHWGLEGITLLLIINILHNVEVVCEQ